MARNPVLAQRITVAFSVSDWLTLLGWMSAHLTEASPDLVASSIKEIAWQVNDQTSVQHS